MNKVDEKGIIYVEQPRVPTLSLALSLFSLLLISLGAISIFALQKPVAETQTVTSQAAVSNAPVEISATQSPATLYDHQTNVIDLNVNTKGIQTTGVTTVFAIATDATDSINVQVIGASNLKSTSQEVQKTTSGFLVKVVTVPTGTAPFSSTKAVPFLEISFNPHSSGSFNIVWDQVYSHVYLSSNVHQEELRFINPMSFVIASNPSANNTTQVISNRACNQGCASNSQCQTGLMCFDNRCRRPGNPDSTSCSNVTKITYTGIVKSCNVACNSNKECDVNMRCFNGACRLATNPSSSSCTPDTVPVITSAYPSPTPTATPNPLAGEKGEEVAMPISTSSATATNSGTTAGFVWPSPTPFISTTPTPAAVYQTEVPTDIQASQNPLQAFLDKLRASSTGTGVSFPIIAVGAGALLLVIALLLLIRRSTRSPKAALPPVAPADSRAAAATQEEQTLEQRISQLKSQQAEPVAKSEVKSAAQSQPVQVKQAPPAAQVAPATTETHSESFKPVIPTTAPHTGSLNSASLDKVKQEVKPTQEAYTDPGDVSVPPTALTLQAAPVPQNPQSSISSNTMMQRIKDKGLNPTPNRIPNPTDSNPQK